MKNYSEHIISVNTPVRDVLNHLTNLPNIESRTLFIIDKTETLIGTITDGDIRRGLIKGLDITSDVSFFMNSNFRYIVDSENNVEKIKHYRSIGVELIPLVNTEKKILKIFDLSIVESIIPTSALIMAGGRGERLKPLTDSIPKPMLHIGEKPIIEHNIDRLIKYGVKEFFISVKYLADQIIDYFGDGSKKGISIKYIIENESLGTIGALSLIENISNQNIIVMNSDLLTNIDFEDFYNYYSNQDCAMCVASIPYSVNIPYAVLETENNEVVSFAEKPKYTYYSNAGVYIMNSDIRNKIPKNTFFNATDLMENIIQNKLSIKHYPILGYWLDIGRHDDYNKAQEDIKHIKF